MHERYKPLARTIGCVISSQRVLRELFRRLDFKGKQLISEYVTSPPTNGVYACLGARFDIDFTDQIQRAIYLGTYERREWRFLNGYIQPGWICVDIGANIGYYTVHLATATGVRGHVYAIEPSPENFAKLEKNVALNALVNCTLSQVAITSTDGVASFRPSPRANSGWGRLDASADLSTAIHVRATTFDAFVDQHRLGSIDFLKIDVEGHELEFVKGAARSLTRGIVKRMMVEYCGSNLEPDGVFLREYLAAFEQHGFEPVHFSMREIRAAKLGRYKPCGAILNLLFEHRSLALAHG